MRNQRLLHFVPAETAGFCEKFGMTPFGGWIAQWIGYQADLPAARGIGVDLGCAMVAFGSIVKRY
jgi:hypothetical protein